MKSLASTSRAWFALPLVTALLLGSVASAQIITSSVPGLISFQGRVTAPGGATIGASPTPANRTVIFRIWSSQSSALATDLVYSEQQTVTIADSEFSVLIGQGTNVSAQPLGYDETTKGPGTVNLGSLGVFAGAVRFLGITVDDGTAAADPEISPRQQIVTSAYAFRAKFAESIGTNGVSALTVVDGGNVGVGFPNPAFRLEVNGNVSAAGSIAATGTNGFTFRTGDTDGGLFSPADNTVVIKTNNADRVTVTSAGVTVNTGTLFAAGHSFTAPGDTDGGIFSPADGTMTFRTDAVERMRLDSSGRLGIGTTTPGFPLSFANTLGDKIAFYGQSGAHYGIGVQNGLLQIHSDAVGADIAFGYGTSAAMTETMRIKGNGNVAIGTSTVTDKLNVGGNVRVTGSAPAFILADAANTGRGTLGVATTAGNFSTDAGISDTVLRSEGKSLFLQSGSGTSAIAITPTNLVGIGIAAPEAKLDVGGNTDNAIQAIFTRASDANFRLVAQNRSASNAPGSEISRFGQAYGTTVRTGFAFMRGGSGDDIAMAVLAGGAERMRFTADGSVGIGTSSPTQAKLVVSGVAGAETIGSHGSLSTGGATTGVGTYNIADASIRATGAIHAIYFRAVSDARIKSIQGRSDGASDLALLNQIEITNYTYIDRVAHGGRPNKRLIGQQVESVFPQAVSRTTDVIADIYKRASFKDGWVELATDLKVGERVRLLDDKAGEIYDVLEVQANRFRTNYAGKTDQVLVYGREVKDFRVVDYEAVSMLNVSATQQLKRETDAEVASLRAENAALRAQLAAQDGRVAAIEKMLATSTTVMARPASASTASGQ